MLWPGPFGTFEYDGLEHPFLNTAGAAVLFFFFLILLTVCEDFWCFPVARTNLGTFEKCQYVSLPAGPFSTFEFDRLEDPFLNTAGVVGIFQYIFLKFCWLFVKTFEVFQSLRLIWGFLSNVSVFCYGVRSFGTFASDWKTNFSILQWLH